MSKVDWSLAPEGATHKETSCPSGFWYKFDFGINQACFWSGKGWTSPISAESYNDGSMDTMEPRPQPKQWSGPQDGLPPVGEHVDYMGDHCTVVAHVHERGQKGAILQGADDWFYGTEITIDPIRTPEQHAAEQRETAIREIMDIADVDCRVTAARLVDAGFKREVV